VGRCDAKKSTHPKLTLQHAVSACCRAVACAHSPQQTLQHARSDLGSQPRTNSASRGCRQGVVLSHVHVQLLRLRGMRPRFVIKETRGKLREHGGYLRFCSYFGRTEPAEAGHLSISSNAAVTDSTLKLWRPRCDTTTSVGPGSPCRGSRFDQTLSLSRARALSLSRRQASRLPGLCDAWYVSPLACLLDFPAAPHNLLRPCSGPLGLPALTENRMMSRCPDRCRIECRPGRAHPSPDPCVPLELTIYHEARL